MLSVSPKRAKASAVALAILLLINGCASSGKRSVSEASTLSYFPQRSAVQPMPSTPYQVEPGFFGYHATCWRPWPDDWTNCPTYEGRVGDEIEVLPRPTEPLPPSGPAQ